MSIPIIIPSKIYRKERCADTLGWAKELIHEAPDGAVFLADVLDRARGRQSRTWMFYEGQLAVTLLLKPDMSFSFVNGARPETSTHCVCSALKVLRCKSKCLLLSLGRSIEGCERLCSSPEPVEGSPRALDQVINYLSMAMSLGILDPIKKYGIKLKWPNDFIFEGKKLGGMLSELVWKGDLPYAVIVGFALNINNLFEPSDPLFSIATSLHAITREHHDLEVLLNQLFVSLDQWYQHWLLEDFESIYHAWKAQQFYLGKKLSVHNIHEQRISGEVVDFLPSGDAIIKNQEHQNLVLPFYMVKEVELE